MRASFVAMLVVGTADACMCSHPIPWFPSGASVPPSLRLVVHAEAGVAPQATVTPADGTTFVREEVLPSHRGEYWTLRPEPPLVPGREYTVAFEGYQPMTFVVGARDVEAPRARPPGCLLGTTLSPDSFCGSCCGLSDVFTSDDELADSDTSPEGLSFAFRIERAGQEFYSFGASPFLCGVGRWTAGERLCLSRQARDWGGNAGEWSQPVCARVAEVYLSDGGRPLWGDGGPYQPEICDGGPAPDPEVVRGPAARGSACDLGDAPRPGLGSILLVALGGAAARQRRRRARRRREGASTASRTRIHDAGADRSRWRPRPVG